MTAIQHSGNVTKLTWKGGTQNTAPDSAAAISEAGSRCDWAGSGFRA